VHLVSFDTTLMAAVPTCGLERVGATAASVRHSGVGHDRHEGIGEWYLSGIPHNFVSPTNPSRFPIPRHALIIEN
jgi:hypothetical protein